MTIGDDQHSIAVLEANTDYGSAEDSSVIPEVCARDARGSISVAEVKILDAVRMSQVSIRLLNGVNRAHEFHKLPVETIGAYWARYPETEGQFLKLRNLGRKSVYKLTDLLRTWDNVAHAAANPTEFARLLGIQKLSTPDQLQKIGVVFYPSTESAPVDLPVERQSTIAKENPKTVSKRGSISVAEVKILDAVRLSQVSVRLRNWVTRAKELPVETIGAYWARYPETEGQFLQIRNLGRKSIRELTDLLKKQRAGKRLEFGILTYESVS